VAPTRWLADEIVQPKNSAMFSSVQGEQPRGLCLLPIPHARLAQLYPLPWLLIFPLEHPTPSALEQGFQRMLKTQYVSWFFLCFAC